MSCEHLCFVCKQPIHKDDCSNLPMTDRYICRGHMELAVEAFGNVMQQMLVGRIKANKLDYVEDIKKEMRNIMVRRSN